MQWQYPSIARIVKAVLHKRPGKSSWKVNHVFLVFCLFYLFCFCCLVFTISFISFFLLSSYLSNESLEGNHVTLLISIQIHIKAFCTSLPLMDDQLVCCIDFTNDSIGWKTLWKAGRFGQVWVEEMGLSCHQSRKIVRASENLSQCNFDDRFWHEI